MREAFALVLVLGFIAALAWAARLAAAPIGAPGVTGVSLDPRHLPEYALRSTLRMLLGLAASLVFTFVYATPAAKSRRAEQILIPLLDVLQSVPVLGYLSFTVAIFMALAPGRLLGAEFASIFAIFTAQAWNMAFSFYQSLRTVPHDLEDAAGAFRLSAWQRFWRLEVPFAVPGLVWNSMMSMSGAWFFVVASEAITVGATSVALPGVGSYVALAIQREDLTAVGYAIVAMLVVIIIYDQLLFRPLVAWSEKFRFEQAAADMPQPTSWVLSLTRGTYVARALGAPSRLLYRARAHAVQPHPIRSQQPSGFGNGLWYALLACVGAAALYAAIRFFGAAGWAEVGNAALLGAFTLMRVTFVIIIATIVWLPIGVFVGLRPYIAVRVQAVAQFLAAFPANLLFPFAVTLIVAHRLNPDFWLSFLMLLGTNWYILFNVIAGATAYPTDFREAAAVFRVRNWAWWWKIILPGIFPYFVTGAITASGGAWNASIVAEYVQWGHQTIAAKGLGAYIAQATVAGDFMRVGVGVAVMSVYVVLLNRGFWRQLYEIAAERLRLD